MSQTRSQRLPLTSAQSCCEGSSNKATATFELFRGDLVQKFEVCPFKLELGSPNSKLQEIPNYCTQ